MHCVGSKYYMHEWGSLSEVEATRRDTRVELYVAVFLG